MEYKSGDFKNVFKKYEEMMLSRKDTTIEEFMPDIILIKKSIGIQILLRERVAEKTNISYPKGLQGPKVRQFLLATELFNANIEMLYDALDLTYIGSSKSNYGLFRNIFETIMLSFYLYRFPSEAENVHKYLEGKFFNGNGIDKSKENDFTESKKKYNPSRIRSKLYQGVVKAQMSKLYGILSSQSHVGVRTLNGPRHETYPKDRIQDYLFHIKIFGFYNIIALLEHLEDFKDINDLVLSDEVKQDINDLREKMCRDDMPNLMPNRSDL